MVRALSKVASLVDFYSMVNTYFIYEFVNSLILFKLLLFSDWLAKLQISEYSNFRKKMSFRELLFASEQKLRVNGSTTTEHLLEHL